MNRRLLNLVTVVSLLLCVALCVLESLNSSDVLRPPAYLPLWGGARVTLRPEGLSFYNTEYPYQGSTIAVSGGAGSSRVRTEGSLDEPVYYRHFTWPDGHSVWVVTVALDSLITLTAILPVARLLLWGVRTIVLSPPGKRAEPNTCRGCGYNLTGNVSGVCPECGAEAR